MEQMTTDAPRASAAAPPESRLRRLLIVTLTALPPACLVALLIRCAVDVPYRDEWALVWYLRRLHDGSLSLHDLWLPHNQHRMLLPRIALLSLARLTSWSVAWELAANVGLAAIALAVLALLARRTCSLLGIHRPVLLLPALSLLVFAPKQSENWLMGYQFSFFLTVLAVVAGIAVLSAPALTWWGFTAAIALGVLASYSTANGLLYWVTALPVVLAIHTGSRRGKIASLSLWLIAAAVTVASYLPVGDDSGGRALALAIAHPGQFATYVLCYLGNPVGPNHIGATALAGLAGLLIVAATCVVLLTSRRVPLSLLAPSCSLALFALGSALLTAVGRVDSGPLQAKVARYVTMATPLWVAAVFLLCLVIALCLSGPARNVNVRGPRLVGGVALITVILILLAAVRGSVKEIAVYQDWQARLAPARAELLAGGDDERLLRELHPDVGLILRERPFLREQRLCVFRD